MVSQSPEPDACGPPLGYIARATLVIVGVVGLAALVWQGRVLFFIAFLALLLSSFLSILVKPLERLRVPRLVAAPVMLLAWLGLMAGGVALAVPLLRDQVQVLQRELPRALASFAGWLEQAGTFLIGQLGGQEADLMARLEQGLGQIAGRMIGGAVPVLGSVVGALGGVLVILFAGLYLSIESRLFFRGVLSLIPVSSRARVGYVFERVGDNLQRWIVGTLIAMVLVGALSGVGLMLLGVPGALALGVITGLLEFIPIFGPIAASIPAIVLGLTMSPLTGVWVIMLYVIVQQIESNVISPLVMKGVVKLPPALTLLFQILMGMVFGFIGLLIAVPLLASAIVMVRMLYVDTLESRASE